MLDKQLQSPRSAKILRNQILALSIGLFLFSLVVKVLQSRSQKIELGKAIALSIERDLEVGDLRAAILNLERSAKGNFSGLQYVRIFPNSIREVFHLGATREGLRHGVIVYKLRPLERDEREGELRFYYDFFEESAVFALLIIPAFAVLGWFLLRRASERFQNELALKSAAKQAEEKAQFAAQIAHDIRSPLAAINAAERDFSYLPEDTRILLKSATSRIIDIANHLLRIEASSILRDEPEKIVTPTLLTEVIDSILSEKRAQYRARLDIEIASRGDVQRYGIFVDVQLREAKRVLSNLIDNAVDALGPSGKVVVNLLANENDVFIEVEDNGKGIPPEILPKLCRRGETYGKQGGTGLGLFHAKTVIEEWKGKLEIRSEVGFGTKICISLPRGKTPNWFKSAILFDPRTRVVVLDDDQSVHRIWQSRVSSNAISEAGILFVHISTAEELRTVVSSPYIGRTTYFLDFEILDSEESGLDLAEELNISSCSTLVTSHYSTPSIIESCSRLGIQIVPKELIGSVPIFINEKCDGYLLDDDDLSRKVWKTAAKRAGVSLQVFSRPEDLIEALNEATPESPIYLDSDLENGVKGEDIARELFRRGFREIYLVTGFPKEHFKEPMPYVKAILGKEPIWTTKK